MQQQMEQILTSWKMEDSATDMNLTEASRQRDAAQEAVTNIKTKGNFLTKAFNKWAKLPKKQKELNAKQEAVEKLEQKRLAAAKACWTAISDIAVTDNAPLKSQLEAETKTQQQIAARQETISKLATTAKNTTKWLQHAYNEAKEASSMELADAISGNAGLKLLSHIETDEAVEAIKGAKKSVETLNNALNTEETLISDVSLQDLRDDNNFDLIVDCLSDVMGAFTSLKNREKLKAAMTQISDTYSQVSNIHNKLIGKKEGLGQEIENSEAKIQAYRTEALSQTGLANNSNFAQLSAMMQSKETKAAPQPVTPKAQRHKQP